MDDSAHDAEFVSLLTENQLALRSYVQSLLPGDGSAADISQQANTTIWKKRDTYELGTNFKAWIFAIARYEVLNYRKKLARDSRLVFSDEMEGFIAEEMASDVRDVNDRQLALRSCLEKLRAKDRDLILHRYFHKTPLKEYAESNKRSVGGLKVTLHRIRAALLECIERNQSSTRMEA